MVKKQDTGCGLIFTWRSSETDTLDRINMSGLRTSDMEHRVGQGNATSGGYVDLSNYKYNETKVSFANGVPVDAFTRAHIVTTIKKKNEMSIRYNGELIAYNSNATDPIDMSRVTTMELGKYCNHIIGEFIIFKEALSKSQARKIENYLGQKWGIEMIN